MIADETRYIVRIVPYHRIGRVGIGWTLPVRKKYGFSFIRFGGGSESNTLSIGRLAIRFYKRGH